MNSTDIVTNLFSGLSQAGREADPIPPKPAIRVKELSERDRRRLLMHFLALGEEDRRLRFGSMLPDELITKYVQRIDFRRDTVFGVYDNKFKLIGAGHLAFVPRDAMPTINGATDKECIAEFGVSVLESARGLGIGSKMFERAAIHCRNADIDTLYMHCLASNKTMIHIAHKAGMAIQRDFGEADAYLKLLPASPASVLQEAVEEQVAVFDYALKANVRAARKWFNNIKK
jgi:GNAT superfamily N-acetyltransferase